MVFSLPLPSFRIFSGVLAFVGIFSHHFPFFPVRFSPASGFPIFGRFWIAKILNFSFLCILGFALGHFMAASIGTPGGGIPSPSPDPFGVRPAFSFNVHGEHLYIYLAATSCSAHAARQKQTVPCLSAFLSCSV